MTKQRIQSVDILRGAIMIIMALDHTRDFFYNSGGVNPMNLAVTTPVFFFTRWITHYCAPNFVFLSGISIYLAGTCRTKSQLSGFLVKRGLWLIAFEVIFISFAITLNPTYNVIVLQVIWAIGFSMIILALLTRAPIAVTAIIGAVIFFGHNLLDLVKSPQTGFGNVLNTLFFNAFGSTFPIGHGRVILDLYAVIPWAGVMMLGYVFGTLYKPSYDGQKRRKILLITGLSTVALYIILRFINAYGDPTPWTVQRNPVFTMLSFLNTRKNPPSLMYLCMTIGPALIVLALAEKVQNKFAAILTTFGSVPFFYYALHIYLIRGLNVVVFFLLGYKTSQIVNPNSISLFNPDNFGFSLPVAYLLWLAVVTALYFPCRWFSRYKKTHKQWWLSYL